MAIVVPDIEIKGLNVAFGTDHGLLSVLEDIEFTVNRGDMCCIVGPSGCGKSTLLRAILKLLPVQSGSIFLNPARVNSGLAFVQQECSLLPWRTAIQNACLGCEVRENLSRITMNRVRRQLVAFGLSGFEDHLNSQLSGGMKQRVAIVRAIEARPALLFCDEPFSAVDFVGRLSLNSQFKHMCRVQAITTLFVTHNIEEAIFLGDMIVVMTGRPGRVKQVYRPHLSVGSEDAVKCRQAPEFAELFQNIWRDLGENCN